ncbi:MAG TPA: hypothetical protein VGB85_07765 [Nannocystis sp.]|jgi:hypothetical protein
MSAVAETRKIALCFAALSFACTANPRPQEATPDDPALPVTPVIKTVVPAAAKVEAAPPVVAAGEAKPVEPVAVAVAQPVGDAPPVAAPPGAWPAPVAVEGVEHLAPAWESAMKLDKPVALETLAGGVLLRVDGVPQELAPDGALVEKRTVDVPTKQGTMRTDVEGVWPDDAWSIKVHYGDRAGSDVAFHKWRGGNRWVPQVSEGKKLWDGEELAGYQWTPRGGMLLVTQDDGVASFMRLAGKHAAPQPMTFGSGYVRDAFESAGGMVFLFVRPEEVDRQGSLEILRSCKPDEAPGCERSGGLTLDVVAPDRHHLGVMAARNRWSISVVVNRTIGGPDGDHEEHAIVHYETGGWKIEAVPGNGDVRQMLAAPDGGLWIVTDPKPQSLWHRSDAGKWVAVDLPAELAGAQELQVALRDPTHVWLAGNVGDVHAIHAAPAALQAAPSPEG